MICSFCQSTSFRKHGLIRLNHKRVYQRLQCVECGKYVKGDEIKPVSANPIS